MIGSPYTFCCSGIGSGWQESRPFPLDLVMRAEKGVERRSRRDFGGILNRRISRARVLGLHRGVLTDRCIMSVQPP